MTAMRKISVVFFTALFCVLLCSCGSAEGDPAIQGRWKRSVDYTEAFGLGTQFTVDYYYEFGADRTYSLTLDLEKCRNEMYEIQYNSIWASLEDMRKIGLSDEEIAEAYHSTMGETIEDAVNRAINDLLGDLDGINETGIYRTEDGNVYIQLDGEDEWRFAPYAIEGECLTMNISDEGGSEYDIICERVDK